MNQWEHADLMSFIVMIAEDYWPKLMSNVYFLEDTDPIEHPNVDKQWHNKHSNNRLYTQ